MSQVSPPLPHSLVGITNNEWSGGVVGWDKDKYDAYCNTYKQATMKPFLEGGIGVEIETKTKFMVATFLIVTIKNTEVWHFGISCNYYSV